MHIIGGLLLMAMAYLVIILFCVTVGVVLLSYPTVAMLVIFFTGLYYVRKGALHDLARRLRVRHEHR